MSGKKQGMPIVAYVEALERTILPYDLNSKCHCKLTQDAQKALENLQDYVDIIVKQADKGLR